MRREPEPIPDGEPINPLYTWNANIFRMGRNRMVDDGTYYITGYEGDESEVVIPTDRVFTILSDKIFRGHNEITSIQIPDTVTDIGEFVFDGCVNLRHLKLPANLRTLWGVGLLFCPVRH